MPDFCAQHNIVSDIALININQINEAYERMPKGDVALSLGDRYGLAEEAGRSAA